VLKLQASTIPVQNIRGTLYLIGTNRCNCELKFDSALVRVGGGVQRLDKYISDTDLSCKRTLAKHMIRGDMSLEQVCDKLMKGEKIKHSPFLNTAALLQQMQEEAKEEEKKPKSMAKNILQAFNSGPHSA